jgi:predicted transcriptional regulator
VEFKMAKTKQFVLEVLASLSDDCSLEDVQYELYVRQRIAEGEQYADQGKTMPHEQVMREAREWLSQL